MPGSPKIKEVAGIKRREFLPHQDCLWRRSIVAAAGYSIWISDNQGYTWTRSQEFEDFLISVNTVISPLWQLI
jgi:hypothetical protein